MLAPRASNAFVCIRCELQLAQRRLPAYPRPTSRANFSTSTRHHDGADELEALSQPPAPGLRIRKEIQPLDRLRKRKGKVIRETSARLGNLKVLGDDAEILVLREVGVDASEVPDAKTEPIEPTEPLPFPDIAALLQQEHEALTPKDIHDRLESLRPNSATESDEPHYVSQKTFVKLIRNLTHGFTQQQLSQFYSKAKNVQQQQFHKEVLASLKGETGTAKRPIARSDWQPGTTPITKRLPGIDVVTRFKRAPVSKQLLVDRIIRDLWKLVPLEEVESRGEIELSLKPWQITMLNAGDEETLLSKISEARKARIEIHQQHNILRITADKTTAEYAANDVEAALRDVQVKKLQLKHWIPYLEEAHVPKNLKLATLYTQEDFHMVTSLTRASIQRMDNTNTLVIRGLNKAAVSEAERTLIRLLPLKNSTLRTIDSQKLDAAKKSSRLYPTIYDENLLEHRYRTANLGRWSSPIERHVHVEVGKGQEPQANTAGSSSEEPATSQSRVARIVGNLRQSVGQGPATTVEQAEKKGVGYWYPEPEYKLSAEFGQALFPLSDSTSGSTAKKGEPSTTQLLFTPSVPGLMSLLSSAYTQSAPRTGPSPEFRAIARTETPSLLYDFIAAPEQQNLGTLPSLHIQLRSSLDGGATTFHKLSLGIQEHMHTVLLPESAVDIQFVRYGRLRYQKNHHDKSIDDWIEAACANIASGERLTAPGLTIDIPNWTIASNSKNAKGMQTVTYLFSGVQFRQAVSGSFLDTPVSYSTTQAGKMGTRGGSLSMYYPGVGRNTETLLQDEEGLNSFVQNSLGLVDKITAAATQTQSVFKVLRPRSNESGRKQRRLAQQMAAAAESEASVPTKSFTEEDNILDILDDAVQQVKEHAEIQGLHDDGTHVLHENSSASVPEVQSDFSSIHQSDTQGIADTHLTDALIPNKSGASLSDSRMVAETSRDRTDEGGDGSRA